MAPPNQNVEPGVPLPDKIAAALARLREAIPGNFDSAYVENALKLQKADPKMLQSTIYLQSTISALLAAGAYYQAI